MEQLHRGTRHTATWLGMVAVGLIAVVGSAQQGPMDTLDSLGRLLRSEPGWTASYHQEYVPAGMTLGEATTGTVWVAWPDRAHFRSGDPVNRLMGLDGRRVRLVDLEAPSCDDHELSEEEWARIPLAAVLDPQAAVDRFTIVRRDDGLLTLIPRESGGGVARVDLALATTGMPRRVDIIDPQGSRNTLTFTDWRPSPEPPDRRWLPVAPDGVPCLAD